MSSRSNNTSGGGIGLCGAVFVVFLVLKLTETGAVARWSWWWVTAPLWIPWGLIAAILAVLGVAWVAMSIAETIGRNRRLARQADAVNRSRA
jgi:uncharacterized membrane protein